MGGGGRAHGGWAQQGERGGEGEFARWGCGCVLTRGGCVRARVRVCKVGVQRHAWTLMARFPLWTTRGSLPPTPWGLQDCPRPARAFLGITPSAGDASPYPHGVSPCSVLSRYPPLPTGNPTPLPPPSIPARAPRRVGVFIYRAAAELACRGGLPSPSPAGLPSRSPGWAHACCHVPVPTALQIRLRRAFITGTRLAPVLSPSSTSASPCFSAPCSQFARPRGSLQACLRSRRSVKLPAPGVCSCSPSSSLSEVFGARLVLPTCPAHPAHPASLLRRGTLLVPRGWGCRDRLLGTPGCSAQDPACLSVEEPHGEPEESVASTFPAPERVLLSPMVQLDGLQPG